jgi:TctA family transporter
MGFEELILKILGNLFLLILAIRMVVAYLKKDYGEMIAEICVAVVIVGFVYFTDQTVGILKGIWNATIGNWFGQY